jgi:heme/copper-type cytochrome/quinol oxidase subunit 2
MNSNGSRIAAAVVAIVVVVVLFFVFKGGDDDNDPTTPTTATKTEATTTDVTDKEKKPKQPAAASEPTIVIKNAEPVGGVADLTFDKGDDVRFVVDSDTADEVHVHGYDIGEDVAAGGKVKFDFPADLEGVFEVELESSATQIAELTVNP